MTTTGRLIGTSRRSVTKVVRSSAALAFVSVLATLVVLPLVLRGVHIQGYGEWATLAAILAVGQLAQTGTGTEIARRVAAAHGEREDVALRQAVREGTTVLVGVALIIATAGVLAARPIVDLVFTRVAPAARGQLTLLLIGIVILFALGLVGNGYFSVLNGLQRSDFSAWSTVASVAIAAIVTVVGISLGLGLWALFVADCVQLAVSWIGPVIGVRKLMPNLGFRLAHVSRAVIVGFVGMPAMLVVAQASDVFDSQIDKLVLTHVTGPKSSAMFQIGAGVVQVVRAAALVPLGVMLAGTAELHKTNPRRLRALESLSGMSAQAIAATTAGGLVLFARPFVLTWLGRGYGGAILSIRVLAVAVLLNLWSAPWIYYALGRRRYHYVLIAATATVVLNLTATIVLTAHIGLNGALIGSLAGSTGGTLTARLVLWRWEARPWLTPALRASATIALLVIPLVIAGATIPASWIALFGWGLLYVLVCGLLLLATGSLPVQLVFADGALPRVVWRHPSEHESIEPPPDERLSCRSSED
jgi:O-antigen/teichoic acid export membrane protein